VSTEKELTQTWLSISEAAEYCRCSRRFIERLLADQALPAYRLGGRLVRLKRADLDDFVAATRIEAVTK